ncbi:MAG: hypothetical protein WCG95_09200, partial [bacterium]
KENLSVSGNRFIVHDVLINAAEKTTDVLKKESLLFKAFDSMPLPDGLKTFNSKTENKITKIYDALEDLYKQSGTDFKFKGRYDEVLTKMNNIFRQGKTFESLKNITEQEFDYPTYRKLAEISKNYNEYGCKDPLSGVYFGTADNQDGNIVRRFLTAVLPGLAKQQQDPLKAENLLFKYINIQKMEIPEIPDTHDVFKALCKMDDFYKAHPNVSGLKHKAEIDVRLGSILDNFIFKKFNIQNLSTLSEKMEVGKRVITWKRGHMFVEPKDITLGDVLNGLRKTGNETGEAKFYNAAGNLALDKQAYTEGLDIIEEILQHPKLSPTFKNQVGSLKLGFQQQAKAVEHKILNGLHSKSAQDFMEHTTVKTVIEELATKENTTIEAIIKKITAGDGKTIKNIIHVALEKEGPSGLGDVIGRTLAGKEAKKVSGDLLDNIIAYLGKINVPSKAEAEYLKNYRLYALNTRIRELKEIAPEEANVYRKILQKEIKEILLGKTRANEVSLGLSEGTLDEATLNAISNQMEKFIFAPAPDKFMTHALEYLEADGEAYNTFSASQIEFFKQKLAEITKRLSVENIPEYVTQSTGQKTFKTPPLLLTE